MKKGRYTKDRWAVWGEYGGTFTNLKDAKECAKEASTLEDDKEASVYRLEDGCYYIDYVDGKMTRDGWTIKRGAKQ